MSGAPWACGRAAARRDTEAWPSQAWPASQVSRCGTAVGMSDAEGHRGGDAFRSGLVAGVACGERAGEERYRRGSWRWLRPLLLRTTRRGVVCQ